jgi:PPOX class probable F420-dependent enzyme
VIERLGSHVPRIAPTAWVHPAATVIGDVEVGDRSSVWPGAVLRGDYGSIRVGDETSVQDGAVIHASDLTSIGSRCVVGHAAFVEDAVIEDECLVGVHAVVLNGARVRTGAIVAGGAVVTPGSDIPSGQRAQGVPATVVPTDRPGREYVRDAAQRYAEMADRYRCEWAPAGAPDRGSEGDVSPASALPCRLSTFARGLATGPNTAYLATVMPDGSPHVSPVWIDVRGDELLVTTERSRVKYRNVRRDPRVAISIPLAADPLRKVDIRGSVVGEIGGQEAFDQIDMLYTRYLGLAKNPWARPDQEWVILRILPERISEANLDPDAARGE